MSIQTFSLGSIHQIMNGAIVDEFDRLIDDARKDCRNRAHIDKPRRITLEVTITPAEEDSPHLMKVEFSVKSALPKADICGYVMTSKQEGLSFSTHAPTNPEQLTFDDDDTSHDDTQISIESGGKVATTTLGNLRKLGE